MAFNMYYQQNMKMETKQLKEQTVFEYLLVKIWGGPLDS